MAGVAGQGKGNPGFLELAGAHGIHQLVRVHLELLEDGEIFIKVKGRPELSVFLSKQDGRIVYRSHFVRQVKLFGQ